MADNLPLIPEKGSLCGDVRPVLRAVFREMDYLPPLTAGDTEVEQVRHGQDARGLTALPASHCVNYEEKYKQESQNVWGQEQELQQQHARRIAKKGQANMFKLHSPRSAAPQWTLEHGLINRCDLVPSIEEDAGRDTALWIKNTLNVSSCDVSLHEVRSFAPASLRYNKYCDDDTLQSLSIGSIVRTQPPAPRHVPQTKPAPRYVVCIPSQLQFVNFTVGNVYEQSIRLVNVSQKELRLSLRPPAASQLQVTISPRGLVVTSGASTELLVTFTPGHVRTVEDELLVRVSVGEQIVVPISCYMQPPVLTISIPAPKSTIATMHALDSNCGPSDNVLDLGARLLGDTHCATVDIACEAKHAEFFVITEDAWLEYNIDCVTSAGCVVSGPFSWWPVWCAGGGAVSGAVRCAARWGGAHSAALRVLSSTAVVRELHLLADVVYFSPKHITIEAQEKDYDILSDDDPACEYYVHLGTAYPNRKLSASVKIVNHSPISYNFYWMFRPWGVCSCWEDAQQAEDLVVNYEEDDLCFGAKEAMKIAEDDNSAHNENEFGKRSRVRVEPALGRVAPGEAALAQVTVERAGAALGVQRAVCMLVLQDIPKQSFPPNYDPMIVKSKTCQADTIPGVEGFEREVCDIVCGQLEVWWEVVPVRFVIDPPVLPIYHSRRVQCLNVTLLPTQLTGSEPVPVSWCVPRAALSPRAALPPRALLTSQTRDVTINIPLPLSQSDYPQTDVIRLVADNAEWQAECRIIRQCTMRCPALRPALTWLGVVSPGEHLHTDLQVLNDTYEHCDGPVATLVQLRSNSEHFAQATTAAGAASLVMFRVVAPRVVLRVKPCEQLGGCECGRCTAGGGALLRLRALLVSRPWCGVLALSNLTPTRTAVHFDRDIHDSDILDVKFIPNDINIGPYEEVEIRVVLEARAVCGRQLFVYRAVVERAYKPIYLAVDTAIMGLEVSCEIPIGGYDEKDSFVIIKRSQQEQIPKAKKEVNSIEDIFKVEDIARELVRNNKCKCEVTMSYIPPSPAPRAPQEEPATPEIVTEPPPMTRVCPCFTRERPLLPELREPICLQFIGVPLRTVHTRIVILRNESVLTAAWSAAVRRWPRTHARTLNTDEWSNNIQAPGVGIACVPSKGMLPSRGQAAIEVQVYCDTWGLYSDQILINIENLEPFVFDVWIEAVGPPLQMAIKPMLSQSEEWPTVWISPSDQQRVLRGKNVSRSEITVHAYLTSKHENPADDLPFRVYLRWFDVLPKICPCVTAHDANHGDSEFLAASTYEAMDTAFELYLAQDFGIQNVTHFIVTPEECTIMPGETMDWVVKYTPPANEYPLCDINLLLRLNPCENSGPFWYRPEPPPQAVSIRIAQRTGSLLVSRQEIYIKMCALDLPYNDSLRIRKRFHVINTGNGDMSLGAKTSSPWCIVVERMGEGGLVATGLVSAETRALCGTGSCCCETRTTERTFTATLKLPSLSSTEICLEVLIRTSEVWPKVDPSVCSTPVYPERQIRKGELYFYDVNNILITMPLVVELVFPVIQVKPAVIDFGFVTDGDTRKTYFSVSHTSRTETLEFFTSWIGGSEFQIYPKYLTIAPGVSKKVYLQYTAVYRTLRVEEGHVIVRVCSGAGRMRRSRPAPGHSDASRPEDGAWCRAAVQVFAAPALDYKCHKPCHDYTDDAQLLPPGLAELCKK